MAEFLKKIEKYPGCLYYMTSVFRGGSPSPYKDTPRLAETGVETYFASIQAFTLKFKR